MDELTYTCRIVSVAAFLLAAGLGYRLYVIGRHSGGSLSLLLALSGLSSLAVLPAHEHNAHWQVAISEPEFIAAEPSTIYHRKGCVYVRRLENPKTFSDEATAQESGRRPCEHCILHEALASRERKVK